MGGYSTAAVLGATRALVVVSGGVVAVMKDVRNEKRAVQQFSGKEP